MLLKRIMTIIFSLLLAAGLAAGCSSGGDQGQAGSDSVSVGTDRGQQAPDFSLATLRGRTLELESLRGKVVLLDFWDTWCPPCRLAMPHLQELSVEYEQDLTVVGIALGRDGENKVRSFAAQNGLTFALGIGDEQLFSSYRVGNLPTTFLLDRSGIVREVWVGGYPKSTYESALQQVLIGS